MICLLQNYEKNIWKMRNEVVDMTGRSVVSHVVMCVVENTVYKYLQLLVNIAISMIWVKLFKRWYESELRKHAFSQRI